MTPPENNGILCRVPGNYIAAALQSLPNATIAPADRMETIMDVPTFGKVRFTCKRLHPKTSRTRTPFWVAERAELVEGGTDA